MYLIKEILFIYYLSMLPYIYESYESSPKIEERSNPAENVPHNITNLSKICFHVWSVYTAKDEHSNGTNDS